jgi:type I restriction enzyme, S subunit
MSKEKATILKELLDGSVQNGHSPLPVNEITGTWVLGLGALTISGLDLSKKKSVEIDELTLEKKLLSHGDFLISRSNTREKVGMASLFKGGLDSCIYPDLMMRFRVNTDKINIGYLDHFLRSPSVQCYFSIKAAGTSGSMVKITKATVEKLPVFLPALEEQKAIADILSTWDEAIEKTEQLIKLKERQLTSFIHRLIHGKNTDRQEFRLGCIAEMQSGGTPLTSNSDYFNGDIPWVSISDMTSRGKYVFDTKSKITQSGLENSSAKMFPSGTVLYAMYASIGECSIAKTPLSTSQAILGIQPSSRLYNEYLYYYLLSVKNKIRKQGQQGTQSNLNAKMVKDFRLYLPSFEKQKKIAGTLNNIQIEIDVLIRKMELLCKQKRGLMQKLLTGKWRVKIKEENHNEQL